MKKIKTLSTTLAVATACLVIFNSFSGKATLQNSLSAQLIGE